MSVAANTATENASSTSAHAKNTSAFGSASCHDAIITIGTSTTVSSTISRPRPSTPSA